MEGQHFTKHYEGKRLFPWTNLHDTSVIIPRSQTKLLASEQEQQFLAANILSQTRMFRKRMAKTKPLQHREISSSPRTFQARNVAYERIANLQHRETSQTPEYSFFDEISFLDKNTFMEDQTVIRTNIFSKNILREDSKRYFLPLSLLLITTNS